MTTRSSCMPLTLTTTSGSASTPSQPTRAPSGPSPSPPAVGTSPRRVTTSSSNSGNASPSSTSRKGSKTKKTWVNSARQRGLKGEDGPVECGRGPDWDEGEMEVGREGRDSRCAREDDLCDRLEGGRRLGRGTRSDRLGGRGRADQCLSDGERASLSTGWDSPCFWSSLLMHEVLLLDGSSSRRWKRRERPSPPTRTQQQQQQKKKIQKLPLPHPLPLLSPARRKRTRRRTRTRGTSSSRRSKTPTASRTSTTSRGARSRPPWRLPSCALWKVARTIRIRNKNRREEEQQEERRRIRGGKRRGTCLPVRETMGWSKSGSSTRRV